MKIRCEYFLNLPKSWFWIRWHLLPQAAAHVALSGQLITRQVDMRTGRPRVIITEIRSQMNRVEVEEKNWNLNKFRSKFMNFTTISMVLVTVFQKCEIWNFEQGTDRDVASYFGTPINSEDEVSSYYGNSRQNSHREQLGSGRNMSIGNGNTFLNIDDEAVSSYYGNSGRAASGGGHGTSSSAARALGLGASPAARRGKGKGKGPASSYYGGTEAASADYYGGH